MGSGYNTLMSETSTLFEFEKDFSASLRCIPMAVRFKLDHSGVKLSLRQWSRFQHQDREQLLNLPCETTEQVSRYRETLVALITSGAIGSVKEIDVPSSPPWPWSPPPDCPASRPAAGP